MKYALIIGNSEYNDSRLAKLTAPGKDAEDLAKILSDKNVGAFDNVKVLFNETDSVIREAIDEFFDQKKPDDLLLLYFSGHGVRDEYGSLFLATNNTNWYRLRATAVKSDFIREMMDQSRSKRQVLILDCCNSGAFPHGTKAATGVSIGTFSAFQGYGRITITASDSTEFAWEGDQIIIGETNNSLFTHFLIEGLSGEADLNSDGRITVDELYDYAYEKVKLSTPKQNPSKFSDKQQGEIVLRENLPIEEIKMISLSDDLINEIEDTRPYVREVAVKKLEKILRGKNIGLARSAKEELEKIITDEDTTRRVADLASKALESTFQLEESNPIVRNTNLNTHRINLSPIERKKSKLDISSEKKDLLVGITAIWNKLKAYVSDNPNLKVNLLRVRKIAVFFVITITLALFFRIIVIGEKSSRKYQNVMSYSFSTIQNDISSENYIFYGVGGRQVFANFNLRDSIQIPQGSRFSAMWYYKVPLPRGNYYFLINKTSYITTEENNRSGYFYLNGNLLVPGQYRIEIYQDNQLIILSHVTIKNAKE